MRAKYRKGSRNLGQYLDKQGFHVVWQLAYCTNKRHLGFDAPYPLARAIKASAALNGRSVQAELIETLAYYYLDVRLPE